MKIDCCATCLYCPSIPTRIISINAYERTPGFDCNAGDMPFPVEWRMKNSLVCDFWTPKTFYSKTLIDLAEECDESSINV